MEEYLIYLVCGCLGVIAHSICKAMSLKMDAEKANIKFTFSDYVNGDWLGIMLSLVMVIFWMFIFPEIVNVRPLLSNFVRISFGAMGFFGSYGIQYVLSKGKRYIRNVVDEKTNIADSIKPFGIGGSNPPPSKDEK